MDIRKILERDHREVEKDFSALERADYQDEDRIEKLLLELTVHDEVEQGVLYPALDEADAELVEEARAAHDELKSLIADLRAARGATRGNIIERLKEVVTEHVEQEEAELFPIAGRALGKKQLEEMGEEAEEIREAFLAPARAEEEPATEVGMATEEETEEATEVEVTGDDFRAVAEELESERHPES